MSFRLSGSLIGMDPLDFGPAATTMARLVTRVTDDQLTARTPCPDYTVADLVDHIGGLAFAFTAIGPQGRGARRWWGG